MIWSILLTVLLLLSSYLTLFLLWRKVDSEHIDGIWEFFDIFFQSSVIGYVVGRIGFMLLSLQFPLSSIQKLWDSPFWSVSLPITLAAFFIAFYRLGKAHWKDRLHLLDLIAILVSFWLAVVFGSLTIIGIRPLLSGSLTPVSVFSTVILPLVFVGLFGLLFVLLTQLEQVYRTFMWYRYRRSSAQSGFVISCFLIGGGLMLLIRTILLGGVAWRLSFVAEAIATLLFILSGFIILYIRSGRFKTR